MDHLQIFSDFFEHAAIDQRIGTAHISVYMALLQLFVKARCAGTLSVNRKEVMDLARIQGRGTYQKCMKELEQYGYIVYSPSFNPVIKCEVQLLNLEKRLSTI